MSRSKKWFLSLALAVTAVLSFGLQSSAAKSNKVVLNTQIGQEIRYLDPQKSTGIGSAYISINLFSGLYEYGHKDAEPVPDMALSAKSNEDASVWTFKLRKDNYFVKYEGGKVKKMRPVTAHDVVYSYRRILSPELASEYSYMLYIIKNAEKYNKGEIKDAKKLGVKAIDDYTVQISMEGSVPSFIQYLPHHSFAIVAKEPIEKHKEKWVAKENIWTSGPFAFKEWKLSDRIVAVKNPHHYDAKMVQLDEVNFRFIGTYSPDAVRAFRAGEIDIDYQDPPTSALKGLKNDGVLKVARMLGTYFIRVNVDRYKGTDKPNPLKDARVRKALGLVVPRGKIVKYVMKSGQIPTYSLVPNAFKGYKPSKLTNLRKYKQRVAEAKKLMAEAGYPNGKGFPKVKYLYNTAENHKKVAVVLTKAWKKELGIDVIPYNQEWKVYLNTQLAKDYDLARAGWIADMSDPMNFIEMFITDGGNNNTNFSHKEYDTLVMKARGERDLVKRARMMEKAETILMSELPVIPIFNYTAQSLVHPYVKGFYPNKKDQHALKYVKLDLKKKKEYFAKMKAKSKKK